MHMGLCVCVCVCDPAYAPPVVGGAPSVSSSRVAYSSSDAAPSSSMNREGS